MPRPRKGGDGGHGGGGGHDGAGGLRWLLTYADLITLLMVFFVVMYSLSKVDQAKYVILAQSLRASIQKETAANSFVKLSTLPAPGEKAPNITASHIPASEASGDLLDLRETGKKLYEALQQAGLDAQVNVVLAERGLVVSFSDSVFFNRGRAELLPRARTVLDRIAPILSGLPNRVLIEGHTDDLPINTAQFPSNWELSSARALAVVRYLTESSHLPAARVGSVAYGEWRPKHANDSEAHRALNRRVDLVLLAEAYGGGDKVRQVFQGR